MPISLGTSSGSSGRSSIEKTKKKKVDEELDRGLLEALNNLAKVDTPAVHTLPENDYQRNQTKKDWRMYCTVFADGVSCLEEDRRNAIRFQMEKMLFEARLDEKKEQEQIKKRKKRKSAALNARTL